MNLKDIEGLDLGDLGDMGGMLQKYIKQLTDAQNDVKENAKSLEPKFTILPDGSKLQINNITSVSAYKKWWWSKIQTEITLNTGFKFVVNCLPEDIKL
jgi:hypothetical protein